MDSGLPKGNEVMDAVVVPIEDSLDLHPFRPADILDVVDDYLAEAHQKGFSEVRLIHGRGIGFQRQRVQDHLSRHPLVDAYKDAPPQRGGWGATLVFLIPLPAMLSSEGEKL